MNEKIKEKREQLRLITKEAEAKAKLAGWNIEDYTKNALIMRFVYNPTGEREFKSFAGWIKENRSVKKGEKGFLLWSQPLSSLRQQAAEGKGIEITTDPEEDKYFNVSYIFERSQTQGAADRKNKQNRTKVEINNVEQVEIIEEKPNSTNINDFELIVNSEVFTL